MQRTKIKRDIKTLAKVGTVIAYFTRPLFISQQGKGVSFPPFTSANDPEIAGTF